MWLYPYLFRLVCRNGAIIAETQGSRALSDIHQQKPDKVELYVREGIGACCAQEEFVNIIRKTRSACDVQADLALSLMPLLSRLSAGANGELLTQIMDRFFRDADRSQFGLANAVTAIARDTTDPDIRWNLEEFGGGIAIGTIPKQPTDSGRARTTRANREVLVA